MAEGRKRAGWAKTGHFVGGSSSGKTTVCQYLVQEDLHYHKTQTVQIVNENLIDTPGEYLESENFRGALTVSGC